MPYFHIQSREAGPDNATTCSYFSPRTSYIVTEHLSMFKLPAGN